MPRDTEIALVVFDWAGTTVDFGCKAPTGAFVAVFADRGVALTDAEARGPMGTHKKDHIRILLQNPAIGARWRAAVGRDWTEADVEAMYRTVTPMQVAAAAAHGALCPGTLECAAALRARGLKLASATGYFREAAEVCFAAGRRQGFTTDADVCADDVAGGRPAPWMIFRAMEATGVYPPNRVVKVGDTAIDIEDGRNAGAWSVGVVDSSNEMALSPDELSALAPADLAARRAAVRARYEAAGADGVVDTLADLPALIEEFDRRTAGRATR